MLKVERQEALIQLLETSNAMSVTELAAQLNTTTMTIRRDLEQLESRGIVRRIHGGAILVKQDDEQTPYHDRIRKFNLEKQRIGKAAAALIQPHSFVYFDSGTTTLEAVRNIPANLAFTAITNSLLVASELCSNPNVSVFMIGGEIHQSSYTATGNMTVDRLKGFKVDMAFLSTKAFTSPYGCYETLLSLIEIKRTAAAIATQVILVADSSKFTNNALCQSIPVEDIDIIVTDDGVDPAISADLESLGKQVIVV